MKDKDFRMEQEGDGSGIYKNKPIGFHNSQDKKNTAVRHKQKTLDEIEKAIEFLTKEREEILKNDKIASKLKRKLLENNSNTLIILSGGKTKKTDDVIYGILIFGSIVIITLSLLNVFMGLSTDITMTFVGTTMGGVIATIAQKLGKLN